MAQFLVAIGLVFVIEGLLFAAFPTAAKRLAATAIETPENSLRVAGIDAVGLHGHIEARLCRIRFIPPDRPRAIVESAEDVTRVQMLDLEHD